MADEFGRDLQTIVEMDIDYCTRTYGVLPCRAALGQAVMRTNLALRSQEFGNATWATSGITRVVDTVVAPDETTTADTYTSTGGSSFSQTIAKAATALQYTASLHVKISAITAFTFTLDGVSALNRGAAVFDLAAMTLTSVTAIGTFTGATAGVEALPGGWYRIWLTVTTGTETSMRYRAFWAGTGTVLTLWGAQLELGLGMSTYKPTTTAAVTEMWRTGTAKCYNGYATCQSKPQFASEPKTLRYGINTSNLPVDQAHIFPALRSVSTRAAEINLSGVDPRSTALGVRGKATIEIDDFTDNDLSVDKYALERVSGAAQVDGIGYLPQDRSTHLRKMAVRFPYYNGRAARVATGKAGELLADYTRRHYVIAEKTGPGSAGRQRILVKDIFDIAEDDKSVLPALSRGKLEADVDDAAGATLTLLPATVGAEYQASGRVCIGGEVALYTRVGDVLTLTQRGMDGTQADSHSAGDLAQECARFDAVPLADALHTVLTSTLGTNPIPTAQIDLAEWQSEALGWLAGVVVTATLTEPYPRKELAGELCQFGALIWPDEVDQTIRFRANRPLGPGETPYLLSDGENLLEKSGDIADDVKERITRVFFWHGMRDPTQGIDGAENMNKGEVSLNAEEEQPQSYDEVRLHQITTRWLGQFGSNTIAAIVADRLASRYRVTPQTYTGMLDDKDARNIKLGDICMVTTRLIVDVHGAPLPTLMQVRYIEDTVPGHRAQIKLQTFTFEGRFGYIMLPDAPDYDAATDAEKLEGAWMVDEAIGDFGDGLGPYVMF